MTEKSFDQLCKASIKAATQQLQLVLLTFTPDGRLYMRGSNNLIDAIYGDEDI